MSVGLLVGPSVNNEFQILFKNNAWNEFDGIQCITRIYSIEYNAYNFQIAIAARGNLATLI
jgi:hypothetical protein